MIATALTILIRIELLGNRAPGGHVFDAGTGDGRIPALLAWFEPSRTVYGIEQDPTLVRQASENLKSLRQQGLISGTYTHVIEGDYCDVATYRACGLDLRKTTIIFNYPDGNQERLAQFVAEHAPDTYLCLLTHDSTLVLDTLTLRDHHDVTAGSEPPWQLFVYGTDQRR